MTLGLTQPLTFMVSAMNTDNGAPDTVLTYMRRVTCCIYGIKSCMSAQPLYCSR